MATTVEASDERQPSFTLRILDQIYGPYSAKNVVSYIREGRVKASTLVSREGGPWIAAAEDPICAEALRLPAPQHMPAPAPEALTLKSTARKPESAISTPSVRDAFLKELQGVRALTAHAAINDQAGIVAGSPAHRAAAMDKSVDTRVGGAVANFIVSFDLKTRTHNRLEAQIAGLGRALRVHPGLWLLSAPMTAGAIRNYLTRFLGGTDTLVVVDASRDKLAWHNLGPETDTRIRDIWRRA